MPTIIWLGGLALAFAPSIFSGLRLSQHDMGDARMNNYVLEHSWRWITGDPLHSAFWDPPIFFPATNTAAYTDILLGVAPLYWPWRAVGIAPDTAFQFWMFTLATLNFWAAYVFLRRVLHVGTLAAASGAFVFAFSSSRTVQLSHVQLQSHFFAIAVVSAAAMLLGRVRGTSRELVWIGVFFAGIVGQLYAGYYLGWFLVFAVLLALLWGLAFSETRAPLLDLLSRRLPELVLGTGLSALALWPMAQHYMEAARTVGYRSYDHIDPPLLQSWVYMSPQSFLYGWMSSVEAFRSLPYQLEHWLGIGPVTTALAILGLWQYRNRPGVRIAGLAAISLVLLSTRLPFDFHGWKVVFAIVPGANAIRALSRIGVMILIPATIGIGLWVGARRTTWATILALAVIIAEQLRAVPSYDKVEARARASASVRGISSSDCDAFLYAPTVRQESAERVQLDAMLGQLEAGVPTINGYSGNYPRGWSFHDSRAAEPGGHGRLRAQLAEWSSRHGLSDRRICVTGQD